MNVFADFGKTVTTNIRDYYYYNTSITGFLETDDSIYVNGIPCDKYTLSPLTFYKDRPMMAMNTLPFYSSPITTTRYFNRAIGDGNKQQYRNPYGPNQTLLKNNARLSNQDEVIITHNNVPAVSAPTAGKGNAALYYTKTTNKISAVLHDDLGNYKASIVSLDDNRYLATKNIVVSTGDCYTVGPFDSYLTLFNKSTNSKSQITVSTNGKIHNIIGRTLAGDLILVNSINTGSTSTVVSAFNISKINKTTLAVTNLVTTAVSISGGAGNVSQEPAFNLDCSIAYFVNASTTVSGTNTNIKYTINKYSIDIPNGAATLVPQTVNLNGLVPFLQSIVNYNNYSVGYKGGETTGPVLTYLEFGVNKYLVITDITNQASIPYTYSTSTYNNICSADMPTYYQYQYMYLFQIVGDTLNLVDYKQTLGGALDTPQAVFPVNNNKSFVCVRYNGLDVITVDTINNKFLIQDTITDPIYSLGVDELERIWYTTSVDALVNDARLKVFSVGAAIIINTDFQTPTLNYTTGTNINSNLIVSAQDNSSNYVVASLQLLLEGNATFASSGTKTLNVSTNATGTLLVPIVIQGDGMINVYTNVNTGS